MSVWWKNFQKETRAEIQKYFQSFFGANENFKMTFRNYLTFKFNRNCKLDTSDLNFQMSNCLFEVLIQETIKKCNCTPEAVQFDLTSQSCFGKDILCADDVFCKYLHTFPLKLNTHCTD